MIETTEVKGKTKVCSRQTRLKNDVQFDFLKLKEQLLESDYNALFSTVTERRSV